MTIWIVSGGWDYEGSTLRGVFNSQEKALEYKIVLEQAQFKYDFVDIEEWDVE
jgi:hypothetical protein